MLWPALNFMPLTWKQDLSGWPENKGNGSAVCTWSSWPLRRKAIPETVSLPHLRSVVSHPLWVLCMGPFECGFEVWNPPWLPPYAHCFFSCSSAFPRPLSCYSISFHPNFSFNWSFPSHLLSIFLLLLPLMFYNLCLVPYQKTQVSHFISLSLNFDRI